MSVEAQIRDALDRYPYCFLVTDAHGRHLATRDLGPQPPAACIVVLDRAIPRPPGFGTAQGHKRD
jgi:hypothetical protein